MLTQVRQRVVRDRKGRRDRSVDPAWTNRRLLLRAGNRLSPGALARLKGTLRADDPTDEIGAAWGVKEQLRRLLASGSLAEAVEHKMRLGVFVLTADMPETDRLWATIATWWDAIEVLIVTGVTNARTEAANTGIKQIKRTGRSYRNAHLPGSYPARQRRPDGSVNTHLSGTIHQEPRRAGEVGVTQQLNWWHEHRVRHPRRSLGSARRRSRTKRPAPRPRRRAPSSAPSSRQWRR